MEKYFELVLTKPLEEAKRYLDGHEQVKQEYLQIIDQYMNGDSRVRLELLRQYRELAPSFKQINKEVKETDLLKERICWLRRTGRPL